jgi:hypothetical protein
MKRKKIILTSLAAAILVGLSISFATTAIWMHVSYRYEPGWTQAEMHHISELTAAQAQAFWAGRRIHYSRREWLSDSLRDLDFWKYLGQRGVVPATGVFFACLFVGALARRDGLRNLRGESTRES